MTQGCSSLRKNIFNRVVADIIAVKQCTERKQQNVLVSKSAYGHVWYKNIVFGGGICGAAGGVVFLSARVFYTRYAKKTHSQHTCQIKLSLFQSSSPFTCNFFSICHLQR